MNILACGLPQNRGRQYRFIATLAIAGRLEGGCELVTECESISLAGLEKQELINEGAVKMMMKKKHVIEKQLGRDKDDEFCFDGHFPNHALQSGRVWSKLSSAR